MSILSSELKLYLSSVIDNSSSNGGYMSNNLLDTVDTENNLFDNVLKEEKTSGSEIKRKLFCKQENLAGEKLFGAQAWLDKQTQATGDYQLIFIGTQTDTQGTISPTRFYGCAVLSAAGDATDTVLEVTVEHSSLLVGGARPIIQTGDAIRISDKTDPGSAGNEEWLTVSNVVNTTGLGMNVTVTPALTNSYAIGSKVSSLLPLGDIQANKTGVVVTSSSGTYNQASILLDNVGTIEDTITLTIKANGISFTANSARLGALADGTFAANYSVSNPNFSGRNYFTVNSAGWGGTWAQNDTLVFVTHPASAALWQLRVVIPGADAQSNNTTIIAFNGQSL